MWAPVPAICARAVLDSGALDLLTRLVELGGTHAGRCAFSLSVRPGDCVGAVAGRLVAAAWSIARSLTLSRHRRAPAAELHNELVGGACGALAGLAADDALRAALQRERATLGEALARLGGVAWSRSQAPDASWLSGGHVSAAAPALAAVLLGEVESEEGAQGGVALSLQAVDALVLGVDTALARPSRSGSFLWSVLRARGTGRRHRRTSVRAHLLRPLIPAQALAVRALARVRG